MIILVVVIGIMVDIEVMMMVNFADHGNGGDHGRYSGSDI